MSVTRDALSVLLLFVVCVKSLFGTWQTCDLTASDETEYAVMALRPDGAERSALYVPLYVAWYRLLLALPVGGEYLPFVSHALLQTALAVLFYLLVRRLGVGRCVGVLASSVLMLHTKLAFVNPFPAHMAAVLVALGALVGTYRRTLVGACGPLGFALLVACYARNEFGTILLAFLPLYLAAGVWSWRSADARREFLAWGLPLCVAVGACSLTVGLPLPDGPRGLFAFGQHYARNVSEATGVGDEHYTVRWREAVSAEFGDVRTVGDAVRAKPRAVLWHVGCNLEHLPRVVLELCRPKPALSNTARTPAFLLMLAVLACGFVGLFRRVRTGGLRGHDNGPLRAVLLALAVALVASGASVVLIYPREHYLVLPMFLLFALSVAGLPKPQWPTKWLGEPTAGKVWAARCAAAAALLVTVPTADHRGTVLQPLVRKKLDAPSLELREASAVLRALPRRGDTVVLMHHPPVLFVTAWMASPVRGVPPELKAEGFREFVARFDIGVMLLDARLRADSRFATDPAFLALWDETGTGPFVVLKTGSCRVAVRRDLLAE